MVSRAVLGDGRGLARLLICRGETTVLGHPEGESAHRTLLPRRIEAVLPVLAVMCKLAGVASTGVSSSDVALGEFDGHHLIDVVEDHLIAVQQYDTLHNRQLPRWKAYGGCE